MILLIHIWISVWIIYISPSKQQRNIVQLCTNHCQLWRLWMIWAMIFPLQLSGGLKTFWLLRQFGKSLAVSLHALEWCVQMGCQRGSHLPGARTLARALLQIQKLHWGLWKHLPTTFLFCFFFFTWRQRLWSMSNCPCSHRIFSRSWHLIQYFDVQNSHLME